MNILDLSTFDTTAALVCLYLHLSVNPKATAKITSIIADKISGFELMNKLIQGEVNRCSNNANVILLKSTFL